MASHPRTIIDKIWDEHVVYQEEDAPAIFAIDLHLIHEVTSPQAFQMLRDRDIPFHSPQRSIATLDHAIPTRKDRHKIHDEVARKQVELLRKNVKDFDIPFFDFESGNQGIVHIIGPENGLTQPGLTIVCGDSHTSTHGAFGAMAFGIGTTEVGYVMATGCLLQNKPKTMRVNFEGTLKKGVYSKDMILALIRQVGTDGGTGYMVEYAGSAIREMSMEARMSICNMTIEWGARAGLIAPDQTTFDYIKGRTYAPHDEEWDKAITYWQSLTTDEDAQFDKEITIDVSELEPMVTWGTNPAEGVMVTENTPRVEDLPKNHQHGAQQSYEYVQLTPGSSIAGTPIDYVFIGSCTNSRLEDLRIAASIMGGKKKNPNTVVYIVPGSEQVEQRMDNEGLTDIFTAFGADVRRPGCSMCLGMNDDKVPAGKHCISTSNRNFVGRQGPGAITHLASPATAAASAITGTITDPRPYIK